MPTLETYNDYPLWRYIPSLPAAIVFAVIFAVLTIGHGWLMVKHRMWFCIPFVVGGVFELVGYAGRAAAHNATGKLIPYVLQSTLLLLAPILFAASLYMTLSRVIRAVDGGHCSLIKPQWLTRVFVAGDCLSFLVQVSGAGLRIMAGTGKKNMDPNLGSNIIVGGLILQIIIFGVFVAAALVFNLRFRKSGPSAQSTSVPWQGSLNMLYITSGAILARNMFRVVEYAMGSDGYLLGVEWGVYVFDAALMTLTMAWFLWQYPSQLKPALKERSTSGEEEAGFSPESEREGK